MLRIIIIMKYKRASVWHEWELDMCDSLSLVLLLYHLSSPSSSSSKYKFFKLLSSSSCYYYTRTLLLELPLLGEETKLYLQYTQREGERVAERILWVAYLLFALLLFSTVSLLHCSLSIYISFLRIQHENIYISLAFTIRSSNRPENQ